MPLAYMKILWGFSYSSNSALRGYVFFWLNSRSKDQGLVDGGREKDSSFKNARLRITFIYLFLYAFGKPITKSTHYMEIHKLKLLSAPIV